MRLTGIVGIFSVPCQAPSTSDNPRIVTIKDSLKDVYVLIRLSFIPDVVVQNDDIYTGSVHSGVEGSSSIWLPLGRDC